MNIVIVTSKYPMRSETFIRDHAIALHAQGHQVHLLSTLAGEKDILQSRFITTAPFHHTIDELLPKNKMVRLLSYLKLRATCLFKKRWATAFTNYNRLANPPKLQYKYQEYFILNYFLSAQVDVLHFHFADNAERYAWLHECLSIPVRALTFHGYDLRTIEEKGCKAYPKTFGFINKFIAISSYTQTIIKGCVQDPQSIYALGNPVQILPKQDAPQQADTFHVISVGRLVSLKNYALALEAIHEVAQELGRSQLRYTLIGDGPEREALEQLVIAYGLETVVTFKGGVSSDEVYAALGQSDVFLHTSLKENLPTVILEAMAQGVPAIASITGGISDIVTQETGYPVTHNVTQITTALKEAITQQEVRLKKGVLSRKEMIAHYSESYFVSTLEKIYTPVSE